MYQDLIKKRSTVKIKGIAYRFLLAMLLLFLFFALSGKAEAICDMENCGGCLIEADCDNTDYCLWNIQNIPMCFNPPYNYIGFEQPVYFLGDLSGQNNWSGYNWWVSNDSYKGVQGSYGGRVDTLGGGITTKTFDRIYGQGFLSFYFKINKYPEFNGGRIQIVGKDKSDNTITITCRYDKGLGESLVCWYDTYYVGFITLNFWHHLEIEFDSETDKWRWRFNDTDFSNWYSLGYDLDYMERLTFDSTGEVGSYFYVDTIKFGSIGCSIENCAGCLELNKCLIAGCGWDYINGKCISYGAGVCGSGANLQFCETETECVNHGGYWSGNYCFWGEEPPSIPNFNDYYNEHSDFDTPSDFISTLAGFLSPLIQSVGGFLTAFENIFDIPKATEKGALFGSAIPNAIAYSGLISDFFNGLPIGEGLLIFIVIIVIVSIFRLVIKLIHIIKP